MHVTRSLSPEVVLQAAMRGRPRPGRDCGRGTAASVRAGRGVRRLLHPVSHSSCCTHTRQEEQSRLNPCLLSHSAVSFQKMLFTVLPSPTPLYFRLHSTYSGGTPGNLGWLPDYVVHRGLAPIWAPMLGAAQCVSMRSVHKGQFHLPHLVFTSFLPSRLCGPAACHVPCWAG